MLIVQMIGSGPPKERRSLMSGFIARIVRRDGENSQELVLGFSGSSGRDLDEKGRSSKCRTSGDW